MGEPNCKKIQELLPEYIEGGVDEKLSGVITSHIRSCPECRRAYETLQAIEKELVTLKDELPDYRETMMEVYSRLGLKRKNVFLRFLDSAIFPAVIATLFAFVMIIVSSYSFKEFPGKLSTLMMQIANTLTEKLPHILIQAFSGDARLLVAANLAIIVISIICLQSLNVWFRRSMNGY